MSNEAFAQSRSTTTPQTPEDGFRRRFDGTHGVRKRPSPAPDNLHDGSSDSPKKRITVRSTWESASFDEAVNAVRRDPTRKTTDTSEASPSLPPFRELLSSSSEISKEENTGNNGGRNQAAPWRLASILPAPGPPALLSPLKDQASAAPSLPASFGDRATAHHQEKNADSSSTGNGAVQQQYHQPILSPSESCKLAEICSFPGMEPLVEICSVANLKALVQCYPSDTFYTLVQFHLRRYHLEKNANSSSKTAAAQPQYHHHQLPTVSSAEANQPAQICSSAESLQLAQVTDHRRGEMDIASQRWLPQPTPGFEHIAPPAPLARRGSEGGLRLAPIQSLIVSNTGDNNSPILPPITNNDQEQAGTASRRNSVDCFMNDDPSSALSLQGIRTLDDGTKFMALGGPGWPVTFELLSATGSPLAPVSEPKPEPEQ
jgi:hypothetical protein